MSLGVSCKSKSRAEDLISSFPLLRTCAAALAGSILIRSYLRKCLESSSSLVWPWTSCPVTIGSWAFAGAAELLLPAEGKAKTEKVIAAIRPLHKSLRLIFMGLTYLQIRVYFGLLQIRICALEENLSGATRGQAAKRHSRSGRDR